MEQFKILFLGPVSSGKTTALRSLCGDTMVNTEARPSDEVLNLKGETTVALDYGSLSFGDDKKLHVYGAPGQERFAFMLDILSQGCLGLVLLINVAELKEGGLEETLSLYEKHLQKAPYVIGFTHADKISQEELTEHKSTLLNILNEDALIIDPREPREVASLVEYIIAKIIG